MGQSNLLLMIRIFLACGSLLLVISCQESFEKRLQREAQEYTESHCPQNIEPGTRLDSTTYSPRDRTYTSWFSLSQAYETGLRGNSALLRPRLVNELINSVDYKTLKDHEVIFRYVYRSQANGATLYETRITPREYKR